MITKISFGIKDNIESPYKEEMSNCFRLGFMSSNFTFNIMIDKISPIVNTENKTLIVIIKIGDAISCVIDCSQ